MLKPVGSFRPAFMKGVSVEGVYAAAKPTIGYVLLPADGRYNKAMLISARLTSAKA